TNFVYHIQHKKRKNSCRWPGVFSVTYQGIKSDISRILSSLLYYQECMYRKEKKTPVAKSEVFFKNYYR
ncbi:hypothetical protein P4722_31830, partial [Priestia megaterium]|uniref:hypothetical protein n=1 Tax=Priestia megaterium TaxID=1404 RepID=UPI002E1B2F18|nr:hypothetical protein [Priestia megaterium]